MALYKITTKQRAVVSGMVIEPGMSVQISFLYANPINNTQGSEQINESFKAIYGVDLKKMGVLNTFYLKEEKIR